MHRKPNSVTDNVISPDRVVLIYGTVDSLCRVTENSSTKNNYRLKVDKHKKIVKEETEVQRL